jgi:hypothetical protein
LGLGYTIKQIYDEHKAIWWAKINAKEAMTRDDFIRQKTLLTWIANTKIGVGVYTKIQSFPFTHWHFVI